MDQVSLNTVKTFVRERADDFTDEDSQKLTSAVRRKFPPVVSRLIINLIQAYINTTDDKSLDLAPEKLFEDPAVSSHEPLKLNSLLLGAAQGDTALVSALLKRSTINVNARGHRNYTPLHLAAQSGHPEVVRLLLQDPRINTGLVTADGKTAQQLAKDKNRTTVLAVFDELIKKRLCVALSCYHSWTEDEDFVGLPLPIALKIARLMNMSDLK